MATFSEWTNKLCQCPYNKYHKVSKTKLAGHLIKCANRLDTPYLKECPHNALHRIQPLQWNEHIHTCPDRVGHEDLAPSVLPSPSVCSQSIALSSISLISRDESNWDDDVQPFVEPVSMSMAGGDMPQSQAYGQVTGKRGLLASDDEMETSVISVSRPNENEVRPTGSRGRGRGTSAPSAASSLTWASGATVTSSTCRLDDFEEDEDLSPVLSNVPQAAGFGRGITYLKR